MPTLRVHTIRARVSAVHRASVQLQTAEGEESASLADRFLAHHHASATSLDRPTVGDWVVADRPDPRHSRVIEVEPRFSTLVRRAAGSDHAPQLLAANVDTALVFSPFPATPNVRRLARLVSLALAGNVNPVIVLSRIDTTDDGTVTDAVATITAYMPDVPVVAISSRDPGGLQALDPWLWPAATLVLLGPSGAGKSTVLNTLADRQVMATADTRADGAGRHTTTCRSLVQLPTGLTIIDTPGLREVGVWASPDVGNALFADVAAVAEGCRFRDCRHGGEPGCAVQAALGDGSLDAARWAQWDELRRETAFVERSERDRKRREREGSLAMRRFSRGQR